MTPEFFSPKSGDFNAESDAINASIQEATEQGNPPSVAAVGVYQSWIDGEIGSCDVQALLTDPNDLAIFKAAEILCMELAGTGITLDFGFLRAQKDIDAMLGDFHQNTKEHEEFMSEILKKRQQNADDPDAH